MRNMLKELRQLKRLADDRMRAERVRMRELRRETDQEIREALRDAGFAMWDQDGRMAVTQ